MKHILTIKAILLLTGCTTQQLPAVVEMPFCDGNTILPSTELMRVERTDSTTEFTFSTIFDDDIELELGDDIELVFGDFRTSMKEIVFPEGVEVDFTKKSIILSESVPVQYRMIFTALPKDVETVDIIQKKDGKIRSAVWGIDLTGKRSPNELPADIPAELLQYDFATGNLPEIVKKEGTVKITTHAAAWRNWMSKSLSFYVNTIDGTQEHYNNVRFNDKGVATIEIPLKGTATIIAMTPYVVYSDFIADPGEDINLYIVPNHFSETQYLSRPNSVIDGKYRNIRPMREKFLFFQEFADTLVHNKTNPDDYFAGMMKIHADGLDKLQTDDYAPDELQYGRALIDMQLMLRTVKSFEYTPEQLRQVRASIDFENPLLEVISIGNPGSRTNYLKAKELILSE